MAVAQDHVDWTSKLKSWLAGNPIPPVPDPVTPPPVTPPVTGADVSVKALDMTDSAPASFFTQAYRDGYRLYAYPPLSWGVSTPRSDAQALFKAALDAGLKVGIYSRDPRWWNQAINAVGSYRSQLQFFAIDIETDPGIPVTRAMVDGVKALGVRPILYSGYGMWGPIMGSGNNQFADLPLWDTNASGTVNPATYTPNVLSPKPVPFGGWNQAGTMRVGIQQCFEITYQGKKIDTNSWSANFLR